MNALGIPKPLRDSLEAHTSKLAKKVTRQNKRLADVLPQEILDELNAVQPVPAAAFDATIKSMDAIESYDLGVSTVHYGIYFGVPIVLIDHPGDAYKLVIYLRRIKH